jgi:hypothetical protein
VRDFVEIAVLVVLVQGVLLYIVLVHSIRRGWLPGVGISRHAWFPAGKKSKSSSAISSGAGSHEDMVSEVRFSRATPTPIALTGWLKVAPTDTSSAGVTSLVLPIAAIHAISPQTDKVGLTSVVPSPTANVCVEFSYANEFQEHGVAIAEVTFNVERQFGLRMKQATNRSVLREFNQSKLVATCG